MLWGVLGGAFFFSLLEQIESLCLHIVETVRGHPFSFDIK